jgi:CobQ-like glutamine amidotransferase family enzyme
VKPTLDITWLYPGILNLHGDRGNVMALRRVAGLMGLDTRVTRVDRLTDEVDFADTDLIVIGAGELAVVPAVVGALSGHAAELGRHIDAGKGLYVSGASVAIVADRTQRIQAPGTGRSSAGAGGSGGGGGSAAVSERSVNDGGSQTTPAGGRFGGSGGDVIEGLGLLHLDVTERDEIYGDDLILQVGRETLVGMQIRMVDLRLGDPSDPAEQPFGRVVYGLGNGSWQIESEGVRRGNAIATNLLGPALVRNPWFTQSYLRDVVIATHPEVELADIPDATWQLERQGAQATRSFVASKRTVPGVIQ